MNAAYNNSLFDALSTMSRETGDLLRGCNVEESKAIFWQLIEKCYVNESREGGTQ